jgi:signal transduction histidine kinase/CheY-like chemotaxis protein
MSQATSFKATPSCIRLFLLTCVFALAVLVLLGFEWTQRQALMAQHDPSSQALLTQNMQIMWLTSALLVFLLIAGAGLLKRNRSQQIEKAMLQALNEQLRQAQQKAEAASEGKSRFLANMSHELRTPFNGMVGILSLLGKTALSETQADLVHTVNQSANHFLNLLNDILDMSAIESGKLSVHHEPVELRDLLLHVQAIMRPLAMQKKLAFVLEPLPSHEAWVKTDGTRLRQILLNLLNNAIKFTDAGTVSLGFTHNVDHQHQPCLEFRVRDTGIGMDESALGQLFQRFYQADASLSRRFSGAGLGLEISRSLAHLMGGSIHAQSEPKHGSEFVVRLPWVPHAELAVNPATKHTPIAIEKTPLPLKILVAEDHPVNQKFMACLLQSLGHQTTFCENGALALQAVQTQPFDIVLMDLHMPIMDGLTATRAIRALPSSLAKLPIVALTADVSEPAREGAQQAGVDAFITKPVPLEVLQEVLTRLGGRGKRSGQRVEAPESHSPHAGHLTPDSRLSLAGT